MPNCKKEVSIIIPAYNEEAGIDQFLKELIELLESSSLKFEIIVVNDGSIDKTELILSHWHSQIKTINHSLNRGYGASLKTGVLASRYELICIIDCDGTYPSDQIPALVNKIDPADMVVGTRTGATVNIPWLRKPAKWILNQLANYLVERKIPDLNSGLRVMKKDAVKRFFKILPNGFSFTSTLTLAFLANNFSVEYIPINYHHRTGKSKIRPIRDTLNFLQLIIRTCLYFNPLKIFLPMSLFLFLSSTFLLFYSYFFTPKVMDISTIVLFVASIQMLAIGMLADLIEKLND